MRNLRLVNENVYSGKNPVIRQKNSFALQTAQFGFMNGLEQEMFQFNEAITAYNSYIEKFIQFLSEAGIGKNDLERAMFFRYLLYNGYLTVGTNDEVHQFEYMIGLNALLNRKTHINVAKLYYDIFKGQYDYPIEYPCFKSERSNSFSAKKASINYAVNIVFYNNSLFGYDAMTNELYRLNGPFEMRTMSEERPVFLRYKPFFDYISKPEIIHSLRDIDARLDYFACYSNLNITISKEDIEKTYMRIQEQANDNIIKLLSFREYSYEAILDMQQKALSKTR